MNFSQADYLKLAVQLSLAIILFIIATARNRYFGKKKRARDQTSINLSQKQYPPRLLEIIGWVLALPLTLLGLLTITHGGYTALLISLLGWALIYVRRNIWLQYTETTVRWRALGKVHERPYTEMDEFEFRFVNRQNRLKVWFLPQPGSSRREALDFDPFIYDLRPLTDRITFYAGHARWPSRSELALVDYQDSLAYVMQLGRQHINRQNYVSGGVVPAIASLQELSPRLNSSRPALDQFIFDLRKLEANPRVGQIFRTLPSHPMQLLPLELWVPYSDQAGLSAPWFPMLDGISPQVEKKENLNFSVDGVSYNQPGFVLHYGNYHFDKLKHS